MSQRRFGNLGTNRNIEVDVPESAAPDPEPPRNRRVNRGFINTVLIIILIVCGLTGGGAYYLQQERQNPAPTAQEYVPGLIPTQPAGNVPIPSGGQKDTVTVCVFPFGAYFPPLQTMMIQNDARPYNLVILPLGLTTPDGTMLISDGEAEQIQWMLDGTCDILFNTSDVLALHPEIGKWITDVGVSDGADKTRALLVGKVGCPGKPITKFNDLAGCVIAVSPNAVGQFQVLSLMKAAQMDASSVTWLTGEVGDDGQFHEFSVEEAAQAFADGKADAFAGWIPYVDDVGGDDSQIIITSTWLRNISDVMIVSDKANEEKPDAIFWFLVDYFFSMKMQQENLAMAGDLIAGWQYTHVDLDGVEPDLSGTYATNDWSYVLDGSEEGDMHLWLDTYGQAGLDANLLLVTDLGVLTKRFSDARDIWAYGGIQMTPLADPSTLTEPKYLLRLAQYVADHPELRPRSGTTLANTSYTPFQIIPASPQDAKQLIELPTVLEVGCVDQLNFKAGENFLRPGTTDYDNFVGCVSGLQQLMSQTQGVTILVTGSAAYWCKYSEQYVKDFAEQRADYVRYALVTGAGIPAPLIVTDSHVGTFSCDDTVNQLDRWVRIEVKLGEGSLR